jgi:hypothetical protein
LDVALDVAPATLHMAALRGDIGAVRRHIEAGSDLGEKHMFGSTPLIVAAGPAINRRPSAPSSRHAVYSPDLSIPKISCGNRSLLLLCSL